MEKKVIKASKELKAIKGAIENYIEKYDGKALVHLSVMGFVGKIFTPIDDLVAAYGTKEGLLIDLQEMQKEIKKSKEDWINW